MNPIYASFTIWLCCLFIVKQRAVINISKMQVCSGKLQSVACRLLPICSRKGSGLISIAKGISHAIKEENQMHKVSEKVVVNCHLLV